jgi:hypothetical protein
MLDDGHNFKRRYSKDDSHRLHHPIPSMFWIEEMLKNDTEIWIQAS